MLITGFFNGEINVQLLNIFWNKKTILINKEENAANSIQVEHFKIHDVLLLKLHSLMQFLNKKRKESHYNQ